MKLLYFARVREAVGIGEEDVALPDGVVTGNDLIHWLAARGGGHATLLADIERLRIAADMTVTNLSSNVRGAREIAFFPPVTGG